VKKFFLTTLLFSILILLSSHEFWLCPDKFKYKQGEQINIRFFIGENFEGINWKGNKEKIKSLRLYYGGVRDDLSTNISNEEGDSLQLIMLDEGTNMISFNSTNTYIEIEAPKFNEYLHDDGLVNAIEYRKQFNETDSMGHELYQRSVKTLIQVGNKRDNTYSIPTDLPVDIIPLSNPYNLKTGDSLHAKILFQQQPLSNYLINLWWRVNDKTIKKSFMSDENGEVFFPVTSSGKWMLSVVKMMRLENDQKAQWQSYWGSLTWGYD